MLFKVDQAMNKDTLSNQGISQLSLWIFDLIRPYIKGRTLDIGSANGEMHNVFLENSLPLHLSDAQQSVCEKLRHDYGSSAFIRNIHQLDFTDTATEQKDERMKNAFDTVLSLNLTKTSFIGAQGIWHVKHLLRTRGHLIFLASSNVIYYPGLDPDWNDLKIKSRPYIKRLLNNDFEILKTRHFDLDGPREERSSSPLIPTIIVISRKK